MVEWVVLVETPDVVVTKVVVLCVVEASLTSVCLVSVE